MNHPEQRELHKDANRIADALMGSTAAERQADADEWNRKADELEAKLRASIARLAPKCRNCGQPEFLHPHRNHDDCCNAFEL